MRKMTEDERRHVETLMSELDEWKRDVGAPAHSAEEHLEAAKLAVDDLTVRVNRLHRWTWLYVAGVLVLIGLTLYDWLR